MVNPLRVVSSSLNHEMVSPTAIFNPFGYQDDQVDAWIEEFQFGDQATQDEVAAELNRYLVEQAWFAPLYRVQGNFPSDADTVVEMLPTNTYPAIYDIYPAN